MDKKISINQLVNRLDMSFRLDGWLPITDYFQAKKSGLELDWVLLLCIDQMEYEMSDPYGVKGELFIPMVAEYREYKHKRILNGWYDNTGEKIDVINHPIYFKQINARSYESLYKETMKVSDDAITIKTFSKEVYPKFVKKVTGKYMEKVKE